MGPFFCPFIFILLLPEGLKYRYEEWSSSCHLGPEGDPEDGKHAEDGEAERQKGP